MIKSAGFVTEIWRFGVKGDNLQVWTVANQKGGVGKTTTTVALAGLAAEQGLRVLMLDLDPHGSLSTYFGVDPDTVRNSSYTLFQQRKNLSAELVSGIIQRTDYQNLSLLPATTALATLERQAIGQDGMGLVISRSLALTNGEFDLVVIDSPPLLGVLMINALAACRRLLVPVQTEYLAMKGLERMVHTLAMIGRSRKEPLEYTVVPTMFDRRTQASVSSLRVMRNTYVDQMWPGKIPVDTRFRDASKAGVPPNLFDPKSRGVEAYRSLLKWILKPQRQPSASPVEMLGP